MTVEVTCLHAQSGLPVSVGSPESQIPGLDLQRQEAEQQAQPRRREATRSGPAEAHLSSKRRKKREKKKKIKTKPTIKQIKSRRISCVESEASYF